MTRIKKVKKIDPEKVDRREILPPLSLLMAPALDQRKIEEIKKREKVPVIVAFPARGDEELETLEREIEILQPLRGRLVDEMWIIFGGNEYDAVPRMARKVDAQIFYAHREGKKIFPGRSSGKGFSMRGFLHHLYTQKGLNHPRAIIEFIDADIRERYFNPRWVIDPVGAILWFKEIEVAKLVYHRPYGGRLNAFLVPFISIFNHPAINPLKNLFYFLSGEIAGTLDFWLSVPFKQNFGIEMKILTSLAFNRVRLRPYGSDLDHVMQVFMGEMDHRHTPLPSRGKEKGLDAMAKVVFQTFLEDLFAEGLIQMKQGLTFSADMKISTVDPIDGEREKIQFPRRLEIPFQEETLSPLACLPEIQNFCPWIRKKIESQVSKA